MNWSDKSLKILGLSDTEILILDTLSVPKNVQTIARNTSISRTGINHVLKNLRSKGLVKRESKGKRYAYLAISFNELTTKLNQATEEIETANTDRRGVKVKTSKEDEFIIHVGAKEIIPAYSRIAAENKNERIRAIQHHRSWNELVKKISPKQLVEFNNAIKNNGIILDGMLNKSAYRDYRDEIKSDPKKQLELIQSLEGRMADYTVFEDNFFNHDSEIWIFKATTLIINWKEEVAIEITNSNITGLLKDMFEFVKKCGTKLDHNKEIRELFKQIK